MNAKKNFEPAERIVFPLDLPNWDQAAALAQCLDGRVGWFKVGLELFTAEGPSVVGRLKALAPRTRIFLDLKLHDIPATVGQAMAAAARLGVDLITVHAQGGEAMLKAAVAQAGPIKVLAVTVLTSLNPSGMEEFTPAMRQGGELVLHLAQRALGAGCHGLVASGHEVAELRRRFGPSPLLVIPGLRPAWAQVAGDDQKRTVTPAQALEAGADLLVIGRPIREAADPAEAADRVAQELQ